MKTATFQNSVFIGRNYVRCHLLLDTIAFSRKPFPRYSSKSLTASYVTLAPSTSTVPTGSSYVTGKVSNIRHLNLTYPHHPSVEVEARTWGAWQHDGPREVQVKALKMQQEKGWDAVRHALTVTVR